MTDYPDLTQTRKELNLLQKLYGLYNTVMDSIDGYFDILWTEVDIEKINNELLDFQNKSVIGFSLTSANSTSILLAHDNSYSRSACYSDSG